MAKDGWYKKGSEGKKVPDPNGGADGPGSAPPAA